MNNFVGIENGEIDTRSSLWIHYGKNVSPTSTFFLIGKISVLAHNSNNVDGDALSQ